MILNFTGKRFSINEFSGIINTPLEIKCQLIFVQKREGLSRWDENLGG
jgi:hypothetical protein